MGRMSKRRFSRRTRNMTRGRKSRKMNRGSRSRKMMGGEFNTGDSIHAKLFGR